MTRFVEQTVCCAVCKREKQYAFLTSMNMLGYADLDLRPAETARRAQLFAVQYCPFCGFCSTDISRENALAGKVISSDRYQETLSDPVLPDIARQWLCCSYIQEAGSQFAAAGWSTLDAAWACDDHPNPQRSDLCRQRTVILFRQALQNGQTFAGDRAAEQMILVDLLRRSGEFHAALALCSSALTLETTPEQGQVLEYQKLLILQEDRESHTWGDVLRLFPSQADEEDASLTPEEEHLVEYVLYYFDHLVSGEDKVVVHNNRRLSVRFPICARIAENHRAEVFANSCPRCGRLPRTPRAKQCFWCGHDWHEAANPD